MTFEPVIRPGVVDMRGYEVADHIFDIVKQQAAINEMFGAEAIGALPCPSGTHGDFIDGEVVPGDLPCRDCGAAL